MRPSSASVPSSARAARVSFWPSGTARWGDGDPRPVPKAVTTCSDERPAARSKERRRVLPSMASTPSPAAPRSSRKASKARPKATGRAAGTPGRRCRGSASRFSGSGIPGAASRGPRRTRRSRRSSPRRRPRRRARSTGCREAHAAAHCRAAGRGPPSGSRSGPCILHRGTMAKSRSRRGRSPNSSNAISLPRQGSDGTRGACSRSRQARNGRSTARCSATAAATDSPRKTTQKLAAGQPLPAASAEASGPSGRCTR